MLSFQSYFESGKFIPLDNVLIPENKRAIVTILDEAAPATESQNSKAWKEFLVDIQNCDEKLSPEFDNIINTPINFRREIDL